MQRKLVKLCFVHSVLNDLLLLCITLRIIALIRVQIVQFYCESLYSSAFWLKALPGNKKYCFQCFQPKC